MATEASKSRTDAMPLGPFLGRRIELAQLCNAVEEARPGQGNRRWIIGSPGVGKSRLLAEIARYAAWRDIPVERVLVEHPDSPRDLDLPRNGPRLLIVDPVSPNELARVDDALSRVAGSGILSLAATASFVLAAGRNPDTAIPATRIVALNGLGPEDSKRLLRAWLKSAFEPAWAAAVVRSTGGHPGRMREAAERFLSTNRRAAAATMNWR